MVITMKKLTAFITVLLIFTLCSCGAPADGQPSAKSTSGQSAAPTRQGTGAVKGSFAKFTATDLNGNTITQDVLKGKKVTMINIWATFCGPCIDEMPDLGLISAEYADRGFQIIGIISDAVDYSGNADTSIMAQAADIITQTKANYLHIVPSDDINTIILSEVTAVPTTVFVEENGNILEDNHIGSRSKREWENIINRLLENA